MNKVRVSAIVNVLTGVTNVALSFPLSKMFGVTGACVSICVAYMLRDILLLIIYHKQLPLDIIGFMKKCFGRMSIPLVLTILCGFGINQLIADGGWMAFLIKAVLVGGIYCLTTLLIGLDQEEKTACSKS